jgi:enamine deaminase RidA (YjgF/YER057c/UK114 family)
MTGATGHRFVNPPDVWDSTPHGFSQAVVAAPGETIYVSGQVDWDAQRTIGSDDLGGQAKGALASLGRVLAAAGASMADVTALRIYIVADADDDLDGVGDALRATFPPGAGPAATWILVRGLANPELRIEIEATAVRR